MMKSLIMTKGLPASGKSTWAKEQVDTCGFKRINKDDLRSMLDNGKWSKTNEKTIIAIQTVMINELLESGCSVIVDDTNFAGHEDRLKSIAEANNAIFEVKDFSHIPLEICIERDKRRSNYVGEEVIKKMHRQFLETPSPKLIEKNPNLQNCIIVDIDGTIANNTGVRNWYDGENVYLDAVKSEVLFVIDTFLQNTDIKVFIFSGRESTRQCSSETFRWLVEKVFPAFPNFAEGCRRTLRHRPPMLVMRKEKDYRKDAIIKKEMYDEHIKDQYNVLAIFDDRKQVVDMWRSLGLQVFAVAEGDF